jgi:hypothetical protein
MLCMYCPGCAGGLEIGVIGTDGCLVGRSGGTPTLELRQRTSGERLSYEFHLPPDIRGTSHGGAVYLEHSAFRDSIMGGAPPLTDAEAAWWSTTVPLAGEAAVETGTLVDLESFAPYPPV